MAIKAEGRTEGIGLGDGTLAGLDMHGLEPRKAVHWNLSPVQLYERALERGEGRLAHMGAFATVTSPHTGTLPWRQVHREGVADRRLGGLGPRPTCP